MDSIVADTLCRMNTRFYAEHAESFSATRSSCWTGWEKLADLLEGYGAAWSSPCTVLDVACGNMRFERFLLDAFPGTDFRFHCVDNCRLLADTGMLSAGKDALAEEGVRAGGRLPGETVRFHQLDVVSGVLSDGAALADIPKVDLSVSFGFLHHIPTQAARIRFVREMLEHTCSGGYAVVSLWRFADEPERREKAQLSTLAGCREWGIGCADLDDGDFLLGWQNVDHAFRYCHSFSDEDAAELSDAVGDLASLSGSFRADGKSGKLNEYLVFRVR